MLWIALVLTILACCLLANQAVGQVIDFEGCTPEQVELCTNGWSPCHCQSLEPRQVAPLGPRRQHGVNYVLDKTIGLTALNYMNPDFPGWPETTEAISQLGFTSAQLWLDIDTWDVSAERAIFHSGMEQVFIKSGKADYQMLDGSCYIMDTAPQAEILRRLYEAGWWEPITVVLTRWEQDWYPEGCPSDDPYYLSDMVDRLEWLIAYESEQQRVFEETRAELLLEYPHARLTVLRSMTVNHFPGYNVDTDHPTVGEAIGQMEYPPDLIGISYWKRRMDPIPALDWLKEVTGFPATRMFLVEFGGRADEQPTRFEQYIPQLWDWGIRTILVWTYQDTWHNKYTVTESGLEALRELMR